jgi:adenylate cyclase
MERRLVAILAADVCGYSARMEQDEAATLGLLQDLSRLIGERVTASNGRVFSRAGDGFLAEFQSPVSAVRAGFEIQRDLAAERMKNPDTLELRIGVHLADVVSDGTDLLGDGVNVAARVESVANPGSVLVSQAVYDQVKRTAYLKFEPIGQKSLKNISEPIQLYRVVGEMENHSFLGGVNRDLEGGSIKVPGSPKQVSVAVLPFENRSGDPEQNYIADGFSEDLITELSRFGSLFVPSRTASFGYRDQSADPQAVGRHLGVDYCLEGSLRRMDNRLRISVQLVQTVNGQSVWADRYDCLFEEIFDVQDDIAARIVSTVVGRVETSRLAAAKTKRPMDLDAYDCVLRGLEYHRLGGITLEDARNAVAWFDKAIEIDPDYARAHAWRSCSRANLGRWSSEDCLDECVESAERALALDENDAEAHRIMGAISTYLRQWEKARFHFERALSLNPNNSFIVARTGELYNFLGEPEKALEMVTRAIRLDPFLPDYCRELEVAALYCSGDFEGACRSAGYLTRMTRRSAAYRAAASVHLQDDTETAEAAKEVLRLDPRFSASGFSGAEAYRDGKMQARLGADLVAAGLPK